MERLRPESATKSYFTSIGYTNDMHLPIVKLTGKFLGRNREIFRAHQGNNRRRRSKTSTRRLSGPAPAGVFLSRSHGTANRTWPDALRSSRPRRPMFSSGLNFTRPCRFLHAFFWECGIKERTFRSLRRRGERSNETPIGVRQSSRSQDNKATSQKGGKLAFHSDACRGGVRPKEALIEVPAEFGPGLWRAQTQFRWAALLGSRILREHGSVGTRTRSAPTSATKRRKTRGSNR